MRVGDGVRVVPAEAGLTVRATVRMVRGLTAEEHRAFEQQSAHAAAAALGALPVSVQHDKARLQLIEVGVDAAWGTTHVESVERPRGAFLRR